MEEVLNAQPNYSGFVVLGAGLPRTGTLSLRVALTKLLKGRVYHMTEIFRDDDADFWRELLQRDSDGKRTHYHQREKWIQFLQGRGYRAGVDYPISLYYREILEAFPDVKIILSVRNPESWYHSVKNTIIKGKSLGKKFGCRIFLKLIGKCQKNETANLIGDETPEGNIYTFDKGMFPAIEEGLDASIAFFEQWVKDVKATVPEDRLLVFEAKDGWGPLCSFLDLPVPEDEPYPWVNDTASMVKGFDKLEMIGNLVTGVLTLTAIGMVGGIAYWKLH